MTPLVCTLLSQGRKNSININFSVQISRGHSWPWRPDAPAWVKKFLPIAGAAEKTQLLVRTSTIFGADVHDPKGSRSSESKCHFRGVIFFAVFLGHSLCSKKKNRNSIASRGVPRGFSGKWHLFSLVLLCMRPMNKCDFRMGTGGGSQGARENPNEKWHFENSGKKLNPKHQIRLFFGDLLF